MDLSGRGVSDRRDDYGVEAWGDEVRAVSGATSGGPPTVVAHSFDGDLADVGCPMGIVFGEHSYRAESARRALATGSKPLPHRLVPNAGHHIVLDQPLTLVEQVRDLLDHELLDDHR